MATPLGHYMVLGTANSMIAEGDPMAGGMPEGPGMGMGRGAGPDGESDGRGFGGPEGEPHRLPEHPCPVVQAPGGVGGTAWQLRRR